MTEREKLVNRIVADLLEDAVLSMNLTTEGLGHVIRVVEGSLNERQLIPNE